MPIETHEDASYECPVCGARLTVDPPLPPHEAPCPACAYSLWCRKRMAGNVIILELLRGRTPEHPDMERVADVLLDSADAPQVIADMSELDFVNSALMARLVAMNKRIRAAEGRFKLCGMQPIVQTAFLDARLHKVFEIHADEQEALAAF